VSEFIPVLAVTGPFAFALLIMRGLPHAARGVMLLVAGITAIVTTQKERRAACIAIVDKVTRRDSGPPAWPRLRPITRR
jgi:hypothetical protein